MENTGKVLFADDSPQWYIASGAQWVGPMRAAEVYEKVLQGQILWTHLVWKPGMSAWQKICDAPTFQALVPKLSSGLSAEEGTKTGIRSAGAKGVRAGGKSTPPPAPAEGDANIWFLYYGDAQYGPFSQDEVEHHLAIGKIHPKVHAWCDGMDNWKTIDKLPEFKSALLAQKKLPPPAPPAARATASAANSRAKENRGAPRKPLVARIMMSDSRQVHTGVCRDISIGGMQVLTDATPGKVGDWLKMNVSTAGAKSSAKSAEKIDSFVAEGVIVRVLEDGRGFSFRFEGLNAAAKRAIENYVQSSG